eukprot:7253791-Alexandrium_andersonii.AAC.1
MQSFGPVSILASGVFGAVVVLTHGLRGSSHGRARPQRRRDAQGGGQRLERVAVLVGLARQLH